MPKTIRNEDEAQWITSVMNTPKPKAKSQRIWDLAARNNAKDKVVRVRRVY